ncbi:hypothetical protein JOF56_005097 [Kibdelosporangium banguiense]|uniref:Uncharacterized protein n=1 Tax=Kibdelosporangium banguiense TaxID=1365924 RepID=A0ABS4TJW8_9PSEU|nr:hypothetical protein [Kibdelosporangium banguiense]
MSRSSRPNLVVPRRVAPHASVIMIRVLITGLNAG